MIKFDHLRIPVADLARSRDWYIRTLGLKVEFEVPDRRTVALQDTGGFTIFDLSWCQTSARCGFKSPMSTPRSRTGQHGESSSLMARASPTGAMEPSSSIPTGT
jgi:catechol 2,3-dioxygenase-like lactoylglutathione lyase family enzyme